MRDDTRDRATVAIEERRDGGARVAGVEWPEVPFWSVSKVGK